MRSTEIEASTATPVTTRFITRRALLQRGVSVASVGVPLLVAGSGCALLADLTRLHVSLADMVAMLERQFPREQRVYDVIDVGLRLPRLQLLPAKNRLATTLAVSAKERIFGRQAQGMLGIEYGLRLEPRDYSVRLASVVVNAFQLEGGSQLSSAWQSIGQQLVQQLLEDVSVFKLSNDRAEGLRKLSLNQAAMTVTPSGLDIRFAAPSR